MPTQFLGTLRARNPLAGLTQGYQFGSMLSQQLATGREKEEEKEKGQVNIFLQAYQNTTDEYREMMRQQPGWSTMMDLVERYYPGMSVQFTEPTIERRPVMPAKEPKVTPPFGGKEIGYYRTEDGQVRQLVPGITPPTELPKPTIAKPGEVVGHWDATQGRFIPDYQVPTTEKSKIVSAGQVVVDKDAQGNWIEKYRVPVVAPPITEYQKGQLDIASRELARKVGADEAANKIDNLNAQLARDTLTSLDKWRDVQAAQGADKIKLTNETLLFEKGKFNLIHSRNQEQDEFLNELKSRTAEREDKRLALETAVTQWTKTKGEAELALAQLKQQEDDLRGWYALAQGDERNRLSEQTNTIKQFIADYQKEIALIEEKRKQSEFELKKWEKELKVPAEVKLLEAKTEEALLPEAGKKNIWLELVGKAMSATKPEWGIWSGKDKQRAARILTIAIDEDPRLDSETKTRWKSYIPTATGVSLSEVLVPSELTPEDVNRWFEGLFKEGGETGTFRSNLELGDLKPELDKIYTQTQSLDEVEKFLNSKGYSLDQYKKWLKKTRK